MTGEEIKAAFEFLAREMTEGFARVHDRFDRLETTVDSVVEKLSHLERRFELLEEKISRLERRFELLEEAVSRLDRRTALLETALTDIKERLNRLSRDVLLGRTEDAARYGALALRVAALEARVVKS